MNRLLVLLLMLLVVLAPLPLGSNREWSWTLCAALAAALTLLWIVSCSWRGGMATHLVHPVIPLLFLFVIGWVVVQTLTGVPVGWQHPLWAQLAEVLDSGQNGGELPGRISLAAEDGWTALMRLLSYALVFFLAFQLAAERSRARAMLGWLVAAGLVYGVFGLVVFWSGYTPEWLFGGEAPARDVRSTLVNRNHFATWQGLTLLCAIAWFYLRMSARGPQPYEMPASDRAASGERFILRAWLPLAIVLLTVTALVLTHSRGGFVASLSATVVLLWLLDSHSVVRKKAARVTVVAALAVCSLAFYLTSEVLLDRIERTDISREERIVVFENVRLGVTENSLLGFGYGTFADSFRLYDRIDSPVHYDRAHNTWLENIFELGMPASLALFAAIGGLAVTCFRGVRRRWRDWAYPALGVAASVLVGVHALTDFSLQIPAVAILYACIMGIAVAQSTSSTQL